MRVMVTRSYIQKGWSIMHGSSCNVFLGGSCNPTTWRFDIAIPRLSQAGVGFYNPQVDDWHEGLVTLEANAKQEADSLLFVIDGQTRAIASMIEATEFIAAGRHVVLVIANIPDGTVIDGQTISGRELKDLNRARTYLRDVAARWNRTELLDTVEQAVESLIARHRS